MRIHSSLAACSKGPLIALLFSTLSTLFCAESARAEDIKVQITLVWATSDEHHKEDAEKKHKQIEPELAKEFKEPFKWKYYFQVHREEGVISSRASKAFKMSKKCEVKVTELAGPDVVVELFGEGKPINRTTKPLQRGELITIGHGDKNDSAWFIVVKRPKD